MTTRSMMQLTASATKKKIYDDEYNKDEQDDSAYAKDVDDDDANENESKNKQLNNFFPPMAKPSYKLKTIAPFPKPCLVFIPNKARDSYWCLRSSGHTTKSKKRKKKIS